MAKQVSKEKSIKRAKTVTEAVICVVLLAIAGVGIKKSFDNKRDIEPTQYVKTDTTEDIDITEPTVEIDPDKIIFGSREFSTRDKFKGDLILVNNDHEYFSTGDEDLVSIMDMNDETDIHCYTAVDRTYSILRNVYGPMAKMIDDFYRVYYNDTLIIYGSYRTRDFQQELYDQFTQSTAGDGDAPIVAMPGFSEHETGYAFDFSETVNYDYQGQGDFAWLNTNCYKYGFVIRYAEDKENITKYRSEPWHFRYVGIAHANYMTQNNLCLEEYIDLLRNDYSYSGEHLQITDSEKKEYEVYFFPSDDASETTSVPVPSGYRYDISGNNVDGFIVTVHKSEKVNLGEENPEPTTEAPTEESDEDPDENSDESSEDAQF